MSWGLQLEDKLERAILNKLGRNDGEVELRPTLSPSEESVVDRCVIEVAPLAALIGVFQVAEQNPGYIDELRGLDPRHLGFEDAFAKWINQHAEDIARASRRELSHQFKKNQIDRASCS